MHVHRIDTLAEFETVQSSWQAIHGQDPHAHIFSSWSWLRGYLQSTSFEWMVLAIHENPARESTCGFIFLTAESKALNTWRILRLGGSPLADYTGFVCLPDLEESVLSAAASYIKAELKWDQLHLWDVLDPRLTHFVASFGREDFTINDDQTTPCPYIELPDSWDEFLLTKLSKAVRKKVRRRTKQVEELPGFRTEALSAENLQNQIDTLFELWTQKWQQPADQGLRPIFETLFRADALWLTTHWDGDTPIAALAGFVDERKGLFYAFMGAYNDDYNKLSPGIVLDGSSIKYAIDSGLTRYDYLRGDHDYKFRWGAEERTIPRLEITRKNVWAMVISHAGGIARKLI